MEARKFVEAACAKEHVPPSVDAILEAIAPLGTCVQSAGHGAVWALALTAPPDVASLSVPGETEDDPDVPLGGVEVVAWTPLVVTAEGGRIGPATEGHDTGGGEGAELPRVDQLLDASGTTQVAGWSGTYSLAVDVTVSAQGDTSLAVFTQRGAFSDWGEGGRAALRRFDGVAVTTDPGQRMLPRPTGVGDLNRDGRLDLEDELSLRLELPWHGNFIRTLPLWAVAMPGAS